MKGASVCLRNRLSGARRAAAMIAFALATTLSATAHDQDKPRWFGGTSDRTAILAYGVPDSDYVILNFSCRPGAPMVKVDVQDETSEAEPSKPLRVRMATGGIAIEFSDKGVVNQESGGLELHGELPLDESLRRILTSDETLEVTVGGHTQRYPKNDKVEAVAAKLFATCEAPKPADDLDVTVTNKATLPLQSFTYSQAGVSAFESGEFGNRSLESGASRTFTIPDGRKICTFDIAVIVAKNDAECCEEPKPAGTHDLCKNGEFVVHD